MSIPIVQMIGTAGDARREIWPSVQYSYFEFTGMNVGDSNYVELGIQAVSWSGNDKWMIGSRSILTFSITGNKVGGGCLVVEISPNGSVFQEYHPFKIVGNSSNTGCSGFELPGWAARFKLVSNDTDQFFRGSIMTRGL